MPIPIEAYAKPEWVRLRDRYTVAGIENQKARFIDYGAYPRSYRNGYFPQPGYNPNHNSITIERVRMDNDDVVHRPY